MRVILWSLVLGLAIAVGTAPAAAQMTAAGTQEIGVSGLVDFDSANGTLIHFNLLYGLFVADGVEVAGTAGVTDDDNHTVWRIGGVMEYDYDLGLELVPYLGAAAGLAKYEVEKSGTRKARDDYAFFLGAAVGSKYFLAENVALDVALKLEWASDDIYPEDDDFQNTDARITLGMRFFF